MDAQLYTDILGDELLKSLEWFKLNVENVYFQQDNDPKHTDLNPIEHLWNYLKRKLNEYEISPRGIHELWERVEME